MFSPKKDIYELLGQFTEIELIMDRWVKDDEDKQQVSAILQAGRMMILNQHHTIVETAMLDNNASVLAQAGLDDVIVPECIDTPTMRQGLVAALSCGGLTKHEQGLKLRRWNERQLGYFVMSIRPFDKGTMSNNELSAFFHVPNLSKAISAYIDTGRHKPNGYEAIDRIVDAIAC